MKDWRLAVLASSELADVTMLLNTGGWVFDDVHQQWTVGLLSIRREPSGTRLVRLRGPFRDQRAYRAGLTTKPVEFSADDLLSWSDSAALPLLKSAEGLDVLAKIRSHPPLAHARPRWAPRGIRELNASDDKEHFRFGVDGTGLWPVYKGESFDIWAPDTHSVYAYADPGHITDVLQARRRNQIRIKRSALYGRPQAWANDPGTLPARHPRIAWRDSSHATDSRTVRVALIPPDVVLVHQAYTLFWREGEEREEAFALGVLSSIPFDWFARQLVESHVTVEFMNNAPVPARERNDPLRMRVEQIAGRLAAADARFRSWATKAGVQVASVDERDRDDLVAELDAAVARIYGLSEDDLKVVFETFHVGWDYTPRLTAVLDHFRDMA